MPATAQASSSGGCQSAGRVDTLLFCYPSPYDVTTYIKDFSSYFETQRLLMLPTSGSALTVPFGPGSGNKAIGTCRKRWKHWDGRDASTLKAECREMDSPFVRCREEDDYQQRLEALLAEVRDRFTVPTLVATDLFCLAEDLCHLYFVANSSY